MFRHGAGSAVDRIRWLYPEELKASEKAKAALEYLFLCLLNGGRASQDRRKHGYTLFRKCRGSARVVPLPTGLVTDCDKFRKLDFRQLEAEIRRPIRFGNECPTRMPLT